MALHAIETKRGQQFAFDRSDWPKALYVWQVYNAIYDTYIKAGVAICQEQPVYQDMKGNFVNKEQQYGELIDHEMAHLSYVLFANKTGINTSFKEDGHEGST